MKYGYLAKADVPPPSLDRKKRRVAGVDELVAGLLPGQVARIEIEEGEKALLVTEQLFKTAVRQRRLVEVWEVGGILFAALAAADPA